MKTERTLASAPHSKFPNVQLIVPALQVRLIFSEDGSRTLLETQCLSLLDSPSIAILMVLYRLSMWFGINVMFCLGFYCPELLRQQLQWQMTLDTPRGLQHLHLLNTVFKIVFSSVCLSHHTCEPVQISEIEDKHEHFNGTWPSVISYILCTFLPPKYEEIIPSENLSIYQNMCAVRSHIVWTDTYFILVKFSQVLCLIMKCVFG